MIRLELKGHVPSKASRYRRSGRAGMHLDAQAAAEITGLQLQLNAHPEWSRSPLHQLPFIHPEVTITFHLRNEAQDRDGTLKTVLDIMQAAGVIHNDNIRHFNGWLHVAPAVITDDEKVVIELKEGA